MKRIVLHIDRLGLRGFAPERHEALIVGLRDALQRHVAEPGTAQALAALPAWQDRPRIVQVSLGAQSSSADAGARLGAAIGRSLSR